MPQTINTKSGRVLVLPDAEEETQINAGIAADPDTFVPTDEQFQQFRRVSPGRPVLETPKERISIRLSPDVLNAFRSTGKGWQTKIDAALKQWLQDHPELS